MKSRRKEIRVGCAGWALSAEHKPSFPVEGTHLQRYAQVFGMAEINSSFYRPHKPDTYRRWAASTPEGFLFTAKLPRTITHERRLRDAGDTLETFLAQVTGLGDRLGALLTQLPASAAFDAATARAFLERFREAYDGRIAWEARHASWFGEEAMALLQAYRVASVAADPAVVPEAGRPGAHPEFAYFRVHGAPRLYYSAYSSEFLQALAARIAAFAGEVFCVFDNTAAGAAIPNALELIAKLEAPERGRIHSRTETPP